MWGEQSGVFTSDSKSCGGTSGVTFDSTKNGSKSNNSDSEGSEFSVSNSFLGDRGAGAPTYNHPLSFHGDLTHTGKSLNLFEDTSFTNFQCDDLPEIGSFEDVERMFRRSDSTFGVVESKEDDFGWLSSEYDKGELGESSRSDFGFLYHETSMRSNVSENHGSSKSITELTETPISVNDCSCIQEKTDSYTSFLNGLGICDDKYGFIPEEQMFGCKNQLKQLELKEGKRKKQNFGNGNYSYTGNSPYELNQLSSRTNSLHGPDLDSGTFTESTSLTPSLFSHPSNQMQCMGSSCEPQSLLTGISGTDNGANVHSFQSSSLMDEASIQDPGFMGEQVKLCGDKFENPTKAGGVSLFIPVEPGSSNVQESSKMVMGVDDISLIAASFFQLQLVMELLDLRTKLCIRDSLYRLAQDVERRIDYATPLGSSSGESFIAKETNNCTSLINMETGTNPVDRSIAQLLFHRPSSSSMIIAPDV